MDRRELFELQERSSRVDDLRKGRGELYRGNSPETCRQIREIERQAGVSIGHTPVDKCSGMCDQYDCSCGWKGVGYYDLEPEAWFDWVVHCFEQGATINFPGYPALAPAE